MWARRRDPCAEAMDAYLRLNVVTVSKKWILSHVRERPLGCTTQIPRPTCVSVCLSVHLSVCLSLCYSCVEGKAGGLRDGDECQEQAVAYKECRQQSKSRGRDREKMTARTASAEEENRRPR